METCETCKNWYVDPSQVKLGGRGLCLKTTTSASQDRLTTGSEDSLATATASVISSFGFKFVTAQLETSPDFGCNQWEGK